MSAGERDSTPNSQRSTLVQPFSQAEDVSDRYQDTLASHDNGEELLGSEHVQQTQHSQESPMWIDHDSQRTPSSVADAEDGGGNRERRLAHANNPHGQGRIGSFNSMTDSAPFRNPILLSTVTRSRAHQDERPGGNCRHIDQLSTMYLQRRLLEYWVTHLSDALAPVPGPRNPLKTIFVPIALDGAYSSTQESNGSVALFHLICAAAAEHLSNSPADPITNLKLEYTTMSLDHHNRGIWHLHRNLSTERPRSLDPMLACLLICIYYEPASAEAGLWRMHFQGAVDWLRVTDTREAWSSESTVILYQMLIATTAMLRSQLLCPEALPIQNQAFLDQGMTAMPEPYWLDRNMGVPRQILLAITKTITLVAEEHHQSNCLRGKSSGYQAGLSRELDQMELELYLSMPKQPFNTETNTDAESSLVYHYSYIFYYASLIYFKRSLREAPLEDVQSLVEQSVTHIEALQQCTTRPFGPMMWPIAITFFEMKESNLQRRALNCLEWHMARSPLSIWRRYKSAVISLWAKRSADTSDLQWDHFLNDTSLTGAIMLT